MGAYGQAVMAERQAEKRQSKKVYPKGFDITLADAISEFSLDEKQITKLGELTAMRHVACAFVGRNAFYRRATLKRLFGNEK